MLKRYELTDQERNRIAPLLPPENRTAWPSIQGNLMMLNAMVWIVRSGAPWRDLPERHGPWETVYSRFHKWIEDGYLYNIFRSSASKPNYKNLVWVPPL